MAKRLVFSPISEDQWRQAHARVGSVYFILDPEKNRVKIGHSRDPWKRLRTLQTGSSSKLLLLGVVAGSQAIEKRLQSDQRGMRFHLEWFSEGEDAIRWLNLQTGNQPMCRFYAHLEPAREVEVWWEWSPEYKVHFKHVLDPQTKRWVGPLMYAGKANARPGWDATAMEYVAP